METADKEGLQRVEALGYQPSCRHTWRSGVRSVMRAASQLFGRGPTDMNPQLESTFLEKEIHEVYIKFTHSSQKGTFQHQPGANSKN